MSYYHNLLKASKGNFHIMLALHFNKVKYVRNGKVVYQTGDYYAGDRHQANSSQADL